jgi:putative FmdB family regulatory protein
MPIYEYQCSACGHQLELLQKMAEKPATECPVCHQPTLIKLMSAAGFQLKGTGWYKTDYSDKGKAPQTGKTESGSDNKDSSGTTSSETKTSDTKSGEKKSTDTSSSSSSNNSGGTES